MPRNKKLILLVLGLIALGGATLRLWAQSSPEGSALSDAQTFPSLPTIDEVRSAGFSQSKLQPPTADGNFSPALYFWVDEAATGATSTKKLLMVSEVAVPRGTQSLYAYGTSTLPFTIPGGIGQEGTLSDNRTAVDFIKGNMYAVIIGPGAKRVETLAALIAGKIE